MCLFKIDLEENADPHTSQENSYLVEWGSFWYIKCDPCENNNAQTLQENGSTTLTKCVFAFLFKLLCSENANPQFLQENVFSLSFNITFQF